MEETKTNKNNVGKVRHHLLKLISTEQRLTYKLAALLKAVLTQSMDKGKIQNTFF